MPFSRTFQAWKSQHFNSRLSRTFQGLYEPWTVLLDTNGPRNATRCVTPSRHRAVHKAGHWVWSTGDSRRSTVDNTRRRSTCRREIIRSWEVGEKLQSELRLCLEIIKFLICLIKILQHQEALSSRPGFGYSGGTTPHPMHWLEVSRTQWLHRPAALK